MKIFIINLKRSVERRQHADATMAAQNVDYSFFDAVDGNQAHPLFNDYDYKKRLWLTSGKMPSKGELGCYASHYLLWMKCISLNEPIIILEDDFIIKENFHEHMDLLEQKTREYGFLRIQAPIRGKMHLVDSGEKHSIHLMEDNFGGAVGYTISPQAAANLVKHRWSLPVDCYIGLPFIHGISSFLYEPSIIEPNYESPTTVQTGMSASKWYRKPSRELYSLYKKIMLSFCFNKTKQSHK